MRWWVAWIRSSCVTRGRIVWMVLMRGIAVSMGRYRVFWRVWCYVRGDRKRVLGLEKFLFFIFSFYGEDLGEVWGGREWKEIEWVKIIRYVYDFGDREEGNGIGFGFSLFYKICLIFEEFYLIIY